MWNLRIAPIKRVKSSGWHSRKAGEDISENSVIKTTKTRILARIIRELKNFDPCLIINSLIIIIWPYILKFERVLNSRAKMENLPKFMNRIGRGSEFRKVGTVGVCWKWGNGVDRISICRCWDDRPGGILAARLAVDVTTAPKGFTLVSPAECPERTWLTEWWGVWMHRGQQKPRTSDGCLG